MKLLRQSCPSCGAQVEVRRDGEVASCGHCGASFVRRRDTLEAIEQHVYLEALVTAEEARARHSGGPDAELVFMPFWVFQGRSETKFQLSHFRESLLELRKVNQTGSITETADIYVPACRTEHILGQSLPIALSKAFDGCYSLKEGKVKPCQPGSLPEGRWISGSKPQKRADKEASTFIEGLHRIGVQTRFEGTDVEFQHQRFETRCYFLHRPFWVFRGNQATVVVDANSGELLQMHEESEVSAQGDLRAQRPRTFARVGLGIAGICFSLLPAAASNFVPDNLTVGVLGFGAAIFLLSLRLLIFGLYSPFRLMVNYPNIKRVGVFIPRLFKFDLDDHDTIFWMITGLFFVPLVVAPIAVHHYFGGLDQTDSFLSIILAIALAMEYGALVPGAAGLLLAFLLVKGIFRFIVRSGDKNSKYSVASSQGFGIPALGWIVARLFLACLTAIPMLLFALLVMARVFLQPLFT